MKKHRKRVTKILLTGLIVGALVTSGVLLRADRSKQAGAPEATQSEVGPSTEQEKQETEAHKDELAEQAQAEKDKPPVEEDAPKKSVTPVITNASQNATTVTVNSFVSGILENNGNCTMKAVKGSLTVSKTVQASANASTTDCAPFLVNRSDFPETGEWSVTVTYSSSTAEGTSQPRALSL